MQTEVAQKSVSDKSAENSSAPGNDFNSDENHEYGAEAGIPAFLQRPHFSNADPLSVQRKPDRGAVPSADEPTAPTSTLANGDTSESNAWIVEDSVPEPLPGQMRRSDFLRELRIAVDEAVDSGLAGTFLARTGFPWIQGWFSQLQNQNAEQIGRALQRYAPETERVESAQIIMELATTRVRRSVQHWLATGEISALPAAIAAQVPRQSRGLLASIANLFFKKRDSGGGQRTTPQAVTSQLDAGAPLDGRLRSGIESAYGQDFSQVKVHTDPKAGQVSNKLNARAFTVGNNIAFSSGEYQPGTLVGDALIAHELAHVAQQRGTVASVPVRKGYSPATQGLEEEADGAAVSAVSAMYGMDQEELLNHEETATLNLTPGLKLQSCNGGEMELNIHPVPFFMEEYTFNDDDFTVAMTWTFEEWATGRTTNTLSVDIEYSGDGRADHPSICAFKFFHNYVGPDPDPHVFQAHNGDLQIDVFGDGSHTVDVTNTMYPHNDWSPPSHWHVFYVLFNGEEYRGHVPNIIVLAANAVPGGTVIEPEQLEAQAEEALASMATGITDIDNLLSLAIAEVLFFRDDEVIGPGAIEGAALDEWDQLVTMLQTYETQLSTTGYPGENEDTLRTNVERTLRYLRLTRRVTANLAQMRERTGYIEDIAGDADTLIQNVIAQYHNATVVSFTDGELAMTRLMAAEQATRALPYNLASLYVQQGRGVYQFSSDVSQLRLQIEQARSLAGLNRGDRPIYEHLEITRPGIPAWEAAITDRADELRRQLFLGQTAGGQIMQHVLQHVEDSQHRLAIFAVLALLNQFRYFKHELNGITGDVLDVLGRDLEEVCDGYITRINQWVNRAEPVWDPNADVAVRRSVMSGIASEFSTMVGSDQFDQDIEAIQERLETIAVIEMVAKVVAIVAVSALVANVAGAAMATTLEGVGVGGAAAWGIVTFTEALAFTFASRLGNELVFGGNETSFLHDLVLNFALFSYLKGANAIYSRILARLAAMEEAALLAGRAVPMVARAQRVGHSAFTHGVYTFGALQAFAEVHHIITHGGEAMGGEERIRSMFTIATIVAVLGLGRNFQTRLTERVQAPIRRFFVQRYARQLEALNAERQGVVALMVEVRGGETGRAVELSSRIQALNEAEARMISSAEGAEGVTGDMIQAELARYQESLRTAELQLAQSGVEMACGQADIFRQLGDGMVAYQEGAPEVAQRFFDQNGGRFEAGSNGIYMGRLGAEVVTFVPERMASRVNLLETALARTAEVSEGMTFVRDRLSPRAQRGLEESSRGETEQQTFERLLDLERAGQNVESYLEQLVGERVSEGFRPERPTAETDPAAYLESTETYLNQLSRGLPAEAGMRIRGIEELGLRSDLRFQLMVRILDPLFNSAARRTALAAHQAAETEASGSSNLFSEFNRVQGEMLRTLRDADTTVGAKQEALDRSITELENLVNGSEHILDTAMYRFEDARLAVETLTPENFGDSLRVDSEGLVQRGEQDLGSFRELLNQVMDTNNSMVERGMDSELVIAVGEPGTEGYRDIMIVSRPVADPAQPRLDTPIAPLDPGVDPGGIILDIGSGTSAFALEMVPESARQGSPVVQTEHGPTSFDPGLLRADLGPHFNAIPRSDGRSVAVFGDPLQNMALLYGPYSVRMLFMNNVNAEYYIGQYLSLARNLMRVMQEGGRVEVQWDTRPEEPGGIEGDRGHIDGQHLLEALNAVAGEMGREFTVNTGGDAITEYDYSIEPSRYRGGPRGPTAVENPVPNHRWIFNFGPQFVGPLLPTILGPSSGEEYHIPEYLRRD